MANSRIINGALSTAQFSDLSQNTHRHALLKIYFFKTAIQEIEKRVPENGSL
jgi:hypothetical protein